MALRDEQGALVLAELALLDDEDDLVDDLAREDRLHLRDAAQARPAVLQSDLAAVVVVEVAEHPEAPVGVRLEEIGELRRLRPRADDERRAEVEAPRAHPPGQQAKGDLLGREEDEVDGAEEDEEPAAHELEPHAVDQKDEDRRAAEG